MQRTVKGLRAAARWGAACAVLALATACQAPPAAPVKQAGLSQQQQDVLRELGFHSSDQGWELPSSGRILFEVGSDVLQPSLRANVVRMGRALNSVGIDHVRVEGHTDNQGAETYNAELSVRRARAVAQVMVDAGMPSQSVVVKGFGYSLPLMKGTSEADRQENRRVAIVVPVP